MEIFELYFSPIDNKQFKAIVTQSPAGEGETESLLPFFEGETDFRMPVFRTLEMTVFNSLYFSTDYERKWMVNTGILNKDQSAFNTNYLVNIGQALYESLFPSDSKIKERLKAAIGLVESKNTQLHIQLKFEADVVQRSRLADYPWELLHDGQGFLLHNQVTISRYIAHETVPPNLPSVERVNVLLVSSAASDSELELEKLTKQEQRAISRGLEYASEAGHISLIELDYATIDKLREYLTEHQGDNSPHVLHFDGHGMFGKRCPKCCAMYKGIKKSHCQKCKTKLPDAQGYLLFEGNKPGEPDYVSAKKLGTLLRQSSFGNENRQSGGIALVVLSACKSAMAVEGDSVFNGAAQNLINHRVPAVVAMQYSISVTAATEFAKQFYRSLGQKNSLAVAISQAREATGIESNQWYRPVLYLRWKDNEGGQLFDVPLGLPKKRITVQPDEIQTPTQTIAVERQKLGLQPIVKDLFSPLSVDWYTETQIALGSRDSYLRVWRTDGSINKEIQITSYPSYVAVHNKRNLAAICYTKLYLVDLETEEVRSVNIDTGASSYIVAWSPEGKYIAVGATNTLKIFTSELDLVAQHHVGGKYGVPALTWGYNGAKLYVGLGNGELWSLSEPFDKLEKLLKGTSLILALRSSGIDNRVACLWKDGNLEILRETEILASMKIDGMSTWISSGPKLAWCNNHKVLACVTGVSKELIFWEIETSKVLSFRLDHTPLAIDTSPSRNKLVLTTDEQGHKQNAIMQVLEISKISAILAEVSTPENGERIQAHLLTADWIPLLDLIKDQRREIEPTYTLELNIPLLEDYLKSHEENIHQFDAEPGILRQLEHNLKTARKTAKKILDRLLWVARQMKDSGYSEDNISVVCNRIVSFSVNSILGKLRIQDFPSIGSLPEFVAFTLGCAQEDLLSLGFDTSDGRGHVACIPLDFLKNIDKLTEMGEILGNKYGITTKTSEEEKVRAGCQLFHDFDYVFSYYEKIELWSQFVLPLAVIRYPRENVIVNPSEVERYGLG